MVLFCPACGMQHIDAPEFNGTREDKFPAFGEDPAMSWTNPPHRSHLCAGCGYVWRPADVPTNGVAAIKTVGRADSPFGADKRVALTDGDEKATANQALGECMYAALSQPAAPAERVTLSDEQIVHCARSAWPVVPMGIIRQEFGEDVPSGFAASFARAVITEYERANGIGKESSHENGSAIHNHPRRRRTALLIHFP